MIPRFYHIPFMGTLWVERMPRALKKPLAGPFLLWHSCNSELLVWLGTFHFIYTPRNWDKRHQHDRSRQPRLPHR